MGWELDEAIDSILDGLEEVELLDEMDEQFLVDIIEEVVDELDDLIYD